MPISGRTTHLCSSTELGTFLIGRSEAWSLTAAQGLLAHGIIQNNYGTLRRAVRECWRFFTQFVSSGGLPWDLQKRPPVRRCAINPLPRGTALHCVSDLALWSKGKGVYHLEWGRSAAAVSTKNIEGFAFDGVGRPAH
jgi:hypothetical protein